MTLGIKWRFNSQLMLPLACSGLRDLSACKEYELQRSLNSNETLSLVLRPPPTHIVKSRGEGGDLDRCGAAQENVRDRHIFTWGMEISFHVCFELDHLKIHSPYPLHHRLRLNDVVGGL